MKKFSAFCIALLLCLTTLCTQISATSYNPSFDPAAQAVYLVNLDSEITIYEKDADKKVEPSLLAQLMTVVLALENVKNPAEEVVAMKGYIEDEMYRQNVKLGGIRLAGLYKNEQLSIEKLMYAVMLRDANEAAMMLADHIGDGSVPYFVELMNKRASELGMVNTHFTTPHGLPDPESFTTAHDIALLARHAMTLPGFSDLISVTAYDGGPTNINKHLNWSSTNRLLVNSSPYYNRFVSGIKSGYHQTLGSYAVSLAKRDGYSYLLVMLASTGVDQTGKDNSMFSVFQESNRLYSWAFETFRVKTLLEKGKSFGEVPLKLSWGKDFLRIMSADNFTALIPDAIESSSIQYTLDLPAYINAPIKKGDLVGQVRLILADEQIGVVAVVAAEDADVSRALLLFETLLGVTRTFWFKFIVILLIVLILIYITLMIIRNRNRRRYRGTGR